MSDNLKAKLENFINELTTAEFIEYVNYIADGLKSPSALQVEQLFVENPE